MAFLSRENIEKLGLKSFGDNVMISDKASIYNPQNIELGDNVRIDDFCILSATNSIKIGSNVHISAQSILIGDVDMDDYSGCSFRCLLLSKTDDFSGEYFNNATVDPKYRNVKSAKIIIKKYTIVGADSIIMPGVIVGENCAIGSKSFVTSNVQDDCIYAGIPAKFIKERKKNKYV